MEPISPDKKPEQIAFTTSDGYTVIPVSDIVWCEAKGGNTCLHLAGGEKLLVLKGLKKLEVFLPEDWFIRVHHHAIAGKRHIRKVLRNERCQLIMSNEAKIPVSARRKGILLKSLNVI